jgi:hypothetical protein
MTALAVAIEVDSVIVSPLKCFRLRCWAQAYLYAAGELDLHSAVDQLQHDAEESGLVAELGQDVIQKFMADAFYYEALQ